MFVEFLWSFYTICLHLCYDLYDLRNFIVTLVILAYVSTPNKNNVSDMIINFFTSNDLTQMLQRKK